MINFKILIVEDELAMQQVLKDKLVEIGYQVITARDGEEALAKVTSDSPDLILLDLVLPKIDGISVMKRLRTDGHTSTPIIILSNLSDDTKVTEAIDNNVHDYLIKTDWKLEDIVKKVEERLNVTKN